MTIHLYEQLASATQSLSTYRKRMHEHQQVIDKTTEALKTQTEYAQAAEEKIKALTKELGITDDDAPITLTQHASFGSRTPEEIAETVAKNLKDVRSGKDLRLGIRFM